MRVAFAFAVAIANCQSKAGDTEQSTAPSQSAAPRDSTTSEAEPAPHTAEILVDSLSAVDERGGLTESIGIDTLGGVFTPLLKAGCATPCVATEIFTTAADDQTTIQIHLYRGDRARAADNRSLGVFNVAGIGSAHRGVPKIEVSVRASPSGVVLSATDLSGGAIQLAKSTE